MLPDQTETRSGIVYWNSTPWADEYDYCSECDGKIVNGHCPFCEEGDIDE